MTGRRLAVDALLVGAGVVAILLGEIPLLVLMAVLTILACGEVFRLTRATGVAPAAGVGLVGALGLLVVAHLRGEDGPIFFPIVVAITITLTFVVMIRRAERGELTDALSLTVLPFVAVGMLAAFVVALRSARDGLSIVLALALMAIANDAVSGLVDPRRGRRPLAPTVRPARTWEGLAAGFAATMLVAVAVWLGMREVFSLSSALVLGVIVAAAAPLGDLSRAMLERDLRADASAAVAVRATVLRRIDGLLFAAPAFFYAFRILER